MNKEVKFNFNNDSGFPSTSPQLTRKRQLNRAPLSSNQHKVDNVLNPNASYHNLASLYDDVCGITLTDPLSHVDEPEIDAVLALRQRMPSAMIFRGSMFGVDNLRIMVDSGSTRECIINTSVDLPRHAIDTSRPKDMRLLTGGGVIHETARQWSNVPISVQRNSLELRDVVQMPLNGLPYDVIIGYPFLFRYDPLPRWRTGELKFRKFSWFPSDTLEDEEDVAMGAISAMTAAQLVRHDEAECILLTVSQDPQPVVPKTIDVADTIDENLPQQQRQQVEELLRSYEKDPEHPLFITREEMPDLDSFIHKRPAHWHMKLPLKPDAKTPRAGSRRFTEQEIAEIRRVIEYLLERKFIQPSESRFSSAVLLVRKPDGTMRFCMDFRALNEQCFHTTNPLPDIRVLTDKLVDAQYLSVIDCAHGYWQLPMHQDDAWKTAFNTPFGQFQWNVVSMGMTSAGSHFQKCMDEIIGPLTDHGPYTANLMDDVLVFSKTFDEHLLHVKAVLDTLHEKYLFLYIKKCHFFTRSVIYLGNKVGSGKREADPKKVDALLNHPEPTTTTELRSFLGIGNYLSIYIKNWADLTFPFGELRGLKKNTKITLDTKQKKAFSDIKIALTRAPVLRLPDMSKPFYVQLDASKTGYGSVLLQKYDGLLLPVAYRSRLPTKAQQKWSIHEMELAALIDATQHFRPYLGDRLFYALSDHKPLEHLKSQPNLSMRQIRWLDHLAMFQYKFIYIKGEDNTFADPLSRPPGHFIDYNDARPSFNESRCALCRLAAEEEGLIAEVEQPFPSGVPGLPALRRFEHSCEKGETHTLVCIVAASIDHDTTVVKGIDGLNLKDFVQGYKTCLFSKELFKILKDKDSKHHYKKKYTLQTESGLMFLNPNEHVGSFRVLVPGDGKSEDGSAIKQTFRHDLIKLFHDPQSEGHRDADGTYIRLREKFYFPNMYTHVRKFCKTCHKCAVNKYSTSKIQGLLQPLKYPSLQPWSDITTDFAVGLPKSKSTYSKVVYDAVQVFVCRLSRRVRLLRAHATDTAIDTARNYVENVFPTHGLPRSIVSDRDPKFVSEFYQGVAQHLGVKLRLTSAHNPQADGQSERLVGIITTMLRIYINYDQNNWADNLGCLEFALNRVATRSRGSQTPFLITDGYNPFSVADLALPTDLTPGASVDFVKSQRIAAARAQDAIIAGQDAAARVYNKKHIPHKYKAGDYVLLRKDHVFPPGERERPSYKMREKYVGPFRIQSLIGTNSLKLDLKPHGLQNHVVFSVGSTKPYSKDMRVPQGQHAPSEDGETQDYVQRVLAMRTRGKGSRMRRQWLCQWKHTVASLDEPRKTWLPFDNFKTSHGVNQQLIEFEESRTKLQETLETDWLYEASNVGSVSTEADGFRVYHALSNETLCKIAEKFDLRTNDLYEQNVMGYSEWILTVKSKLKKGTQIRFPRYLAGYG